MNTPHHQEPTIQQENKLKSDQFEELQEALETLYIQANISGRIQFAKNWPGAATHILGAELIKYDEDGTQDREHRAELEDRAEDKRIALLSLMGSLEANSVQDGALQLEYVKRTVTDLGRDLALHIYGAHIVDRFIAPPPPPPPSEDEDSAEEGASGDDAPAKPLKQDDIYSDNIVQDVTIDVPETKAGGDISNAAEASIGKQEEDAQKFEERVKEQERQAQAQAEAQQAAQEQQAQNAPSENAPQEQAQPESAPQQPENAAPADPMDAIQPIDMGGQTPPPAAPAAPQQQGQPPAQASQPPPVVEPVRAPENNAPKAPDPDAPLFVSNQDTRKQAENSGGEEPKE